MPAPIDTAALRAIVADAREALDLDPDQVADLSADDVAAVADATAFLDYVSKKWSALHRRWGAPTTMADLMAGREIA